MEKKDQKPTSPAASTGGAPTQPRRYPLSQGNIDTLVLLCPDGRFAGAFESFLAEELKIERGRREEIIAPAITGYFARVQKFWHVFSRIIGQKAKQSVLKRIVVITHDECRGYAEVAETIHGVSAFLMEHFQTLAGFIRKELNLTAKIEHYHADIIVAAGGERWIEFKKVIEV